jgi:hypothetical protein
LSHKSIRLSNVNKNIVLPDIMNDSYGFSESVSVILILVMVAILGIAIGAIVFGVTTIPQATALIAVDMQKTSVSGHDAISMFHRAGETAVLIPQQQSTLAIYADTASASYRVQPPAGIDTFSPGSTLYLYKVAPGQYAITSNPADLSAALPFVYLTSVRLIDLRSNHLIAQWQRSTGGGSPAPAPTISGISPSSGPSDGSTDVSISGTNLLGATAVTFDGITAGFSVDSATSIRTTTPAHAAAGSVDVVVATPNGTATASGGYTYVASPVIGGISPASGPASGGTSVTISGTDLLGVNSVTFGGVPAAAFSGSSTSVSATTPVYAAGGAVDVVVTTTNGTATARGAYTYVAPPAFSSISPATGTTAGGTPVTIIGSNFVPGGLFSVTIGGADAAGVFVDATHITATTPTGTAGTKSVVITNNDGQTATGTYTYAANLIITTSAGTGGTISPSGSVSVPYGTSRAFSISPNSGYHINTVTVDGASQGAIAAYTFPSVTTNHNIAASFTANPTITQALSTTTGRQGRTYTNIRITGTGFITSPYPTVTLSSGSNTMTGTVTACTSTRVTFSLTIPSSQATGSYSVTVTNSDGGTATRTSAFTVTT